MWKRIKPYILPFAVAIAIPLSVGLLSAALTKDSMSVYENMNKPPLSPPPIVFPIVWTILFTLMGISSALVYINRHFNDETVKSAFTYYGASLVLNFIWTLTFFRLQAALLAFIVLIALLYFIIKTIIEYYKVNKIAAFLQIPYALWVAFAGYLNLGIVRML